ncbi:MAG: DUF4157 domain-containing protein [Bacteroidota bacterium]
MYSLDHQSESHKRSAASQNSAPAGKTAPPLSLKADPVQMMGEEEEEEIQMKAAPIQKMGMEEEEALQGKFAAPVQRSAASENLTGMPDNVKSGMEQSMGSDFSSVRIHANSSKAPEVNALAYTQGNDIHFAPGQFKPDTSSGQELLGHELAHVKQQSEGRVQATTEVNGMPVNDDNGLESEADRMGAIAASQLKKKG